MRRGLLAAVMIATSVGVSTPVAVHGQLQQPLRTFCMTSAREYCASIFSWEVTTTEPGAAQSWDPATSTWVVDPGHTVFSHSLFALVQFGGSLMDTLDPFWNVGFTVYQPGIFADRLVIQTEDQSNLGGLYSDGWGAVDSFADNPYTPPTIYDITGFEVNGGELWCVPVGGTGSGPACYEVSVPEPSSLLLILGGLLGLAFVGKRRKTALA